MSSRALVTVAAAVVVAALVATLLLTSRAGARFLAWSVEWAGGSSTLEELRTAQAIALLGGRTRRVHDAARLQRQTGLPMLVSGKGTGDAPFAAESEKMAQILRTEYRIEPRWLEKQSLDTVQNALYSWCLVEGSGVRRVALVTDPRHMLRARTAFAAAGFDVLPAPTPSQPRKPLTWQDLLPAKSIEPESRQALLEWTGAVATLWQVWFGRSGDAQAHSCASSSARMATKLHTAVRNNSQAPGRASRRGKISSAVRRRESSQSRPSREDAIPPSGKTRRWVASGDGMECSNADGRNQSRQSKHTAA
jgi:uncharacterized SAM-binding protein YcdF (DUF218 family)